MSRIMLLGRPLTFGDKEQIEKLREIIKDAEHKEYMDKYRCKDCKGDGQIDEECDECGGSGYISEDCNSCNGEGVIEP